MNRSILIVLAIVIVAAGAYYWYANLRVTPEEQTLQDAATLLTESVVDDLSTAVDTSVSPVGETPDVNPVERANPFSGVKTNPFE